MTTTGFTTLATWADLQAYIRAGYQVFYQAPLDARPAAVSTTVRRDGLIRVCPIYRDCDPFNADAGHLSRFRCRANP